MKVSTFPIERSGPGRLSTMARPRGGEWLYDELEALRAVGSDIVVSMLTATEARELDLGAEADAVTAAGMEFLSLPTPDRGTPYVSDFLTLLNKLGRALQADKHVVVHCRMGIGRSSLVAAGLLVAEGVSQTTAWETVTRARGLDVPDTAEQKSWLAAVMASR